MIKIVADNKIPFLKGVLDKVAEVVYFPGREISREHVADADALIVRTRTRCNEQLLAGSSVRYVATATIGFDHIDRDYLDAAGIKWSNAPGCNSGSVMQYVASALAFITAVSGKKFVDISMGIIGAGHVGKKIERLCRTLGVNVILNDPPRERAEGSRGFSDMDSLLSESDIVTLHVPLNPAGPDKTYHLANRSFFSRLKQGAWFVNTSRGEVTDTTALLGSLRMKRISGAVLDVWENEPRINNELLALCDIGTPHIAGYSQDGKANGTSMSVRALSRFFGLGMDDWYPSSIPDPAGSEIKINSGCGGLEEVAQELFSYTYNINEDSSKLKSDPVDFEKFRDNYPPRREFGAYRVLIEDHHTRYNDILLKLGFKLSILKTQKI